MGMERKKEEVKRNKLILIMFVCLFVLAAAAALTVCCVIMNRQKHHVVRTYVRNESIEQAGNTYYVRTSYTMTVNSSVEQQIGTT